MYAAPMAYRDEAEGLWLRVEDLEAELSSARETIARMQGESVAAEVEEEKPQWFTGAAKRLRIERELPFELTDSGYEAIADLLRGRWPTALISQIGGTLTCRFNVVELRVARMEGGRTQVRMTGNYAGWGVLQGMGCAGVSVAGLGRIHKSRKELAGLFETVALLAAKHAKPQRKRIVEPATKGSEASAAEDAEAVAEAEAQAEAEAVAEAEAAEAAESETDN